MEPALFEVGGQPQFLMFAIESGTTYNNWDIYLVNGQDLGKELIRSYEECLFAPALFGDFDDDGLMEIMACPGFLINDGGPFFHYESYCEILEGPDYDPVFTSQTWIDTLISFSTSTDFDRDGIADPTLTTTSYAEDSVSFFSGSGRRKQTMNQSMKSTGMRA